MGLALFDVDGTLIHAPSSEKAFFLYLLRHGLIRFENIAEGVRFYQERRHEYGPSIFKKNKAYLAGLPVDEVEELAARFVRESLVGRLRASVHERLDAHLEAGDSVALVTGTPSFIAAALAEALGVPFWRAARLPVQDGRFTSDPLEFHPMGEDKILAAREICDELDADLCTCHAYGDSIHDLPLLLAVESPVAVHPDRALRREARARHWEMID